MSSLCLRRPTADIDKGVLAAQHVLEDGALVAIVLTEREFEL